ncbi:MAG: S1 RNA-binding domain-containing protein, partial [Clostridia bacterium]
DVLDMRDLAPGTERTGTVRNVIDLGAFVDIGVHQDGLVHVSHMADRFIRHPSEVVKVGDVVKVWVLEIDEKRGRIALTMVKP